MPLKKRSSAIPNKNASELVQVFFLFPLQFFFVFCSHTNARTTGHPTSAHISIFIHLTTIFFFQKFILFLIIFIGIFFLCLFVYFQKNKQSMEKLHKKKRLADQTMADESDLTGNLMKRSQKAQKYELMEKVYDVKEMIDHHRNQIHSNVTKNAQETISFLRQLQKKNAAIAMIKEASVVKRNPKQIAGTAATNGAATAATSSAEVKQTKSNSLAGLLEVWKILRGPSIAVSVEQNSLVEDEVRATWTCKKSPDILAN